MRLSNSSKKTIAVFGSELHGVVVVAERHAGSLHLLADAVELVGHVAPVVEVHLAFACGIAVNAGPGTDDVLEPDRLAVFDQLVELRSSIA